MRYLTYVTLLAASAATISTQAAAQQTPPQSPTKLPVARVLADSASVVTVQNERGVPVTVYLDNGTLERKLGVVGANSTTTLSIPAWAGRGSRSIRLLARPQGEGFTVATPTVALEGTMHLGLVVPPRYGVASTDSVPVMLTAEERASTTVTLENPLNRSLTVFAEQGVRLVKLGEVAAKGQTTLRLPKDLVGSDVRIFVRAAGGNEVATRPLNLKNGDHISVDIVF